MDRMDDLVGADMGGRDGSPPLAELLKPSEVARMLGVSRAWLYDAAKDGPFPAYGSVDRTARCASSMLSATCSHVPNGKDGTVTDRRKPRIRRAFRCAQGDSNSHDP
jgi:hypothetical protein